MGKTRILFFLIINFIFSPTVIIFQRNFQRPFQEKNKHIINYLSFNLVLQLFVQIVDNVWQPLAT